MGVLERIESIIRSNLNETLEKTEDPERSLGVLISEMESELADARIQMAAAIREGKRLKSLYIETEESVRKWQDKAVLAVQRGRDELAKEALLRKRSAANLANEYKHECDLHEEVISSLKSGLKSLEEKIREAKRKKSEIAIKRRQMQAARFLESNSMADKETTFNKLEDKIISLSAEIEAMEELNDDELESKFREDELEEELAKLKNRMKSEEK